MKTKVFASIEKENPCTSDPVSICTAEGYWGDNLYACVMRGFGNTIGEAKADLAEKLNECNPSNPEYEVILRENGIEIP